MAYCFSLQPKKRKGTFENIQFTSSLSYSFPFASPRLLLVSCAISRKLINISLYSMTLFCPIQLVLFNLFLFFLFLAESSKHQHLKLQRREINIPKKNVNEHYISKKKKTCERKKNKVMCIGSRSLSEYSSCH